MLGCHMIGIEDSIDRQGTWVVENTVTTTRIYMEFAGMLVVRLRRFHMALLH